MSKVEMMSAKDQKKGTLAPPLRFPEFREAEEWEKKEISDLLTIGNGKDYKHLSTGTIPVYGTGGYMLSVNDYLYDGESVCIGRKGTIDNPFFVSGKFWTVDTLFYTHKFNNTTPKFIYFCFQRIKWSDYNAASGVPSLSKSTIERIKIAIPAFKEQKKIADFFSSLDERIAAESDKLDALKAHKNGLLKQLFPAEGEILPALRFPEFRDAGEWEEANLIDLVHFYDGFAFKSTEFVKSKQNATQVVRITDINNKNLNTDKIYIPNDFLKHGNFDKYRAVNGDLLLSLTGAAGFNFFFWDGGDAVLNQRTMKIAPKNESWDALVRLIEPLAHEKINARGEGQNNNLSKEFLNCITIIIPASEEQHRIADCLSSLDELITAQTQKIDLLKDHKKGLMQQLFPALDEVRA